MAAQFEQVDGDDRRRRLLDAADKLVAAVEDARHSSELRHIGGDLVQLQHDVERVRRTIEHQPTLGLRACEVFEFWR
jgi:hypothetical protein